MPLPWLFDLCREIIGGESMKKESHFFCWQPCCWALPCGSRNPQTQGRSCVWRWILPIPAWTPIRVLRLVHIHLRCHRGAVPHGDDSSMQPALAERPRPAATA